MMLLRSRLRSVRMLERIDVRLWTCVRNLANSLGAEVRPVRSRFARSMSCMIVRIVAPMVTGSIVSGE